MMKLTQSAVAGIGLLLLAGGVVAQKPNFVVILTDDQDQQMDSMQYMHGVRTLLTEQGTIFPNHYCTVAVCCPSRVNLWTGKAAHNTNVTDLQPPYGMHFL
jgi:N-acetylglucosamine-6-sulfatase